MADDLRKRIAEILDDTTGLADAVMAVVEPELEELRQSNQTMSDLMERVPKVHMRFGVLNSNGTVEQAPKCADWCWLCRIERAEAAIARVRRLSEMTIATSIRVQAIDQARDTLAALDMDTPTDTPGDTP